tara:strand:+ start:57 stop:500 length:444 start_codon:yes stop_codon:yes gene_type:complete
MDTIQTLNQEMKNLKLKIEIAELTKYLLTTEIVIPSKNNIESTIYSINEYSFRSYNRVGGRFFSLKELTKEWNEDFKDLKNNQYSILNDELISELNKFKKAILKLAKYYVVINDVNGYVKNDYSTETKETAKMIEDVVYSIKTDLRN